jgi:type IV pilus biogenesis protein CpaD/CtpE
MKCKSAIISGGILAALGLAGCTPNDVNLGASARHNYAMQVINPEPVYEDAAPTIDGTKAATAVERYRKDNVKKPAPVLTTDGGSGSGSK